MLPMENRTLARTAEIVGKSVSMMEQWSADWFWRDRVAQYEEHYMLLNLESIQAKRDDMFLKHEALAMQAMSIVEQAFQEILATASEEDGKIEVAPGDLQRLFDTAVKVHRMSILGRAESAEQAAETQERLAERFSDELAELMRNVLDDLNLSPEQQEIAKASVTRHLVGGEK